MESPTSSTSATVVTRRPVGFIDGDDNGLASVPEISLHQHQNNYSRTCGGGINRKSSLRNISIASSISSGTSTTTVASPRNNRFYIDARYEEMNHQPYFLEACYLCRKPLGGNRDIFMYRGDTPFCSEECRQEQIEIDECKEKNNISAKMKALRSKNKESQKSAAASSSSGKNYPYRATGTTVAAA